MVFKDNKQLPTHIKQETIEKCVEVCCLDIRPYDFVAGKGFVDISQHFVDVAAKYGKFDVKHVLPHPTTVSRHVKGRVQVLQASVAAEIKPIIETYGCAITTDIWTEDYHKTSFISGTIHYTNNNFDLVSRVLFGAPFESGVSKTGENIRSLLFQKLCEFGIDASLLSGRVVFVTDRGANIVAALRGYTRLNCNAHILNITLSSAFAPDVLAESTELSELLTSAKKLVKYFKHSGLQNSLKKSLKQSIETRWNSNYEMLDSILQQHEEICTLLLKNNQYERITQISANTLKTVAFLKLFKEATNDLESDNSTPSASLPLPWSVKLIEHCQAAMLESLLSGVANVCASRLEVTHLHHLST
ncbi:Transposable element Hobo transposase [Labeo rohita]|uniref:Transposable element Hobo transposase n=1 Tax=Labeo rohita TaxID=84645 RepID=A0ABQ8L848_LABRO|nr:Transposable element Hobo transposase [Labeo rohita]